MLLLMLPALPCRNVVFHVIIVIASPYIYNYTYSYINCTVFKLVGLQCIVCTSMAK